MGILLVVRAAILDQLSIHDLASTTRRRFAVAVLQYAFKEILSPASACWRLPVVAPARRRRPASRPAGLAAGAALLVVPEIISDV